MEVDVDLDGEVEYILSNDRVFALFENDGGRLRAAFARNPSGGEGFQVIGAPLGNPENFRESEWEGATNGQAQRVSGLKDWWSTGHRTNRYVNDLYGAARVVRGWRFTSSDGAVSKTITLADGSPTLSVHYRLRQSVGTLYVRFGLSPRLLDLLLNGQQNLSARDDGSVFRLSNDGGGTKVSVEIAYGNPGHNARYNPHMSDGTAFSPRNAPLAHQVELAGEGDIRFALTLAVSP
jgi:hypothetical protein